MRSCSKDLTLLLLSPRGQSPRTLSVSATSAPGPQPPWSATSLTATTREICHAKETRIGKSPSFSLTTRSLTCGIRLWVPLVHSTRLSRRAGLSFTVIQKYTGSQVKHLCIGNPRVCLLKAIILCYCRVKLICRILP